VEIYIVDDVVENEGRFSPQKLGKSCTPLLHERQFILSITGIPE